MRHNNRVRRQISRGIAAALLVALVGLPMAGTLAPASAQHDVTTDPRGDAEAGGPDITRVSVRNQQRKVIARVWFAGRVRGDVLVGIKPRRSIGVRMSSLRQPDGTMQAVLLPGGSFGRLASSGAWCPGFKVFWTADKHLVTMVLPSRCLNRGRYGAIRYAVLTESGSDSDYAPQTRSGELGQSRWLPRG